MTQLIGPVQDLISVAVFVFVLIALLLFVANQFGGLAEAWLRGFRKRDDDLS